MKKYIMAGIFAVVIIAAGILVLYNYNANSKQEININADESQNDIFVSSFYDDIKEIRNSYTGMVTSDEVYIQQIADVFSQLKIEYTGKVKTDKEIKFGGWVFAEFKYNNSDKIITVGLGEGEKLHVEDEEYIIKNDNHDELCKKYYELMHDIS